MKSVKTYFHDMTVLLFCCRLMLIKTSVK